MARLLARFGLCLLLVLAFAAACTSEDSKKKARGEGEGAGQAGVAGEMITSGGSMADAGMPSVTPEGGKGGAPELPTSGQGGEPAVSMGGVGGEAGMSGAGGEAAICCKPKTCADIGYECGADDLDLEDGCGGYVTCACGKGQSCDTMTHKCVACVPSADPCGSNPFICGATTDECGNAITCPTACGEKAGVQCIDGYCRQCQNVCQPSNCGMVPDNCGSFLNCPDTCADSGGKCVDGNCQVCKTVCAPNDCGVVSDNCGGTIDCTAQVCDGGECDGTGHCCTPLANVCDGYACGNVWDNCKAVPCGATCTEAQVCDITTGCQTSLCKANGYECDSVPNAGFASGVEPCGYCGPDTACVDHHCVPLCK